MATEWTGSAMGLAAYVFALLLSGGVLLAGVRNFRLGVSIRWRDPVPVGDVGSAPPILDVEGVAQSAGETVDARLSNEPCLGYTYRKYKNFNPRPETDSEWARIDQDENAVPFYVEGDGARVVVDPEEMWLDFEEDRSYEDSELRESESRLEPGDEIHVFAQRHDDAPVEGESVSLGDGDRISLAKLSQGDEVSTSNKHLVFGALLTLVGGFFFAMVVFAGLRGAGVV